MGELNQKIIVYVNFTKPCRCEKPVADSCFTPVTSTETRNEKIWANDSLLKLPEFVLFDAGNITLFFQILIASQMQKTEKVL